MVTNSKTDEHTRNAQMIAGTEARLQGAGPFTIDGKTYTTPEVVARITQRNALLDSATSARAQERTAVATEKTDRPGWNQFINAFRAIVSAMFVNDMQTLQLFDITPRKPAKKTTEVKMAAVTKMRATRKARHTMGRKARLAVRGNVPQAPIAPAASAPPGEETSVAEASATTAPHTS
jgi:hypothetical protein